MEIEIEDMSEKEEKPEGKKEYGKYEKWEIESAAGALEEAEKIKADPEKMKYVKMCMEKKLGSMKKAISSLADLKEIRASKLDKDSEDDSY